MASGGGESPDSSVGCDPTPSPEQPTLSPEDLWRAEVQTWYPKLFSRTYCVPHVYMNQVPYRAARFAGHEVLVLDPAQIDPQTAQPAASNTSQASKALTRVQESDVRNDFAQQHVLFNLQALGDSRRPQPMFIIANLRFRDFLVRSSAQPKLPKGEFDVVTVNHANHNIGVGELKSFGLSDNSVNRTEARFKADVANRVKDAIVQLNRQKKAMQKMVPSSAPGITVTTFLMLPYISRATLVEAVESDDPKRKLPQELCRCLGARDTREAAELCLCSDDVSDRSKPWHVSPAVLSRLDAWFARRFVASQGPAMSDGLYLNLIARLCGPATAIYVHCPSPPRLEVHSVQEAVSHVGERMAQIVLTPKQVDLLNAAPKLAWLTGPPGTGKTVCVLVQGLVWLNQGHDVHVVSINKKNLASSHMVCHQLTKTLAAQSAASAGTVGTPHLHLYDFVNRQEDVDTALQQLMTSAEPDGSLRVIVDECPMPVPMYYPDELQRFFDEVSGLSGDVCVWANCVHNYDLPDGYTEYKLSEPLRCPPFVLRQVQPAVDRYSNCDVYSASACPAPCEGPPEMWLNHSGPGHTAEWPIGCRHCGLNVAGELRKLGVGTTGNTSVPASQHPPLRYSDVLVLTQSSELKDETTVASASGDSLSDQVCGFVAGLRSQGIPVRVLPLRYRVPADPAERKIVADVATAATDIVTVTDPGWVRGLERKVVVVLPGRHEEAQEELQWKDDVWALKDRMDSFSRCSSQLIVVQCSGHPLQRHTYSRNNCGPINPGHVVSGFPPLTWRGRTKRHFSPLDN